MSGELRPTPPGRGRGPVYQMRDRTLILQTSSVITVQRCVTDGTILGSNFYHSRRARVQTLLRSSKRVTEGREVESRRGFDRGPELFFPHETEPDPTCLGIVFLLCVSLCPTVGTSVPEMSDQSVYDSTFDEHAEREGSQTTQEVIRPLKDRRKNSLLSVSTRNS